MDQCAGGGISPETGLLLNCQVIFGFGVLVLNKHFYQRDAVKEWLERGQCFYGRTSPHHPGQCGQKHLVWQGCTQLQVQRSRRGTKQMPGYDGSPCNRHSMSVLRGKLSWAESWAQLQLKMKNTQSLQKPFALLLTGAGTLTVLGQVTEGRKAGHKQDLKAKTWWLCVTGIQGRLLWIMHFNSIVSHKKKKQWWKPYLQCSSRLPVAMAEASENQKCIWQEDKVGDLINPFCLKQSCTI